MKSTGTFGDTELQETLASESKVSVEQIRYLEAVRRRIIENALKDGKKVFVNGIAVVSGLRGSFSSVDGPFDPKRNKVYIKVTPQDKIQKALAKVMPVIVGGSESALMVAEVFTGTLGAKGVSHPVTVEARKKTALVLS